MAYWMLGRHINVVSAMAIEGLLSGALAVAFLVPGGLGVQEASYVLIGQAFGMPAHLSIGLSFLRRARDIIIGAPALIVWQAVEMRHLRRDGKETESATGADPPAGQAISVARRLRSPQAAVAFRISLSPQRPGGGKVGALWGGDRDEVATEMTEDVSAMTGQSANSMLGGNRVIGFLDLALAAITRTA